MNSEGRKSRGSVQRAANFVSVTVISNPFFSEPPVQLPNLDQLRSTDVLVRAYCASQFPPTPSPCSTGDSPHAPTQTPPTLSALVTDVGEQKLTGETVSASVAREIVELAADLFASRSLDRLVGSYTAYAAWDDMRDVVATSFLPQDLGEGWVSVGALRTRCGGGAASSTTTHPMAANPLMCGVEDATAGVPLFLRSALSLAGIPTRHHPCRLTPQSAIRPPPLAPCDPRAGPPLRSSCPVPPASVPIDAFCRYVIAVEEAPVLLGAHETSSTSRRGAHQRPRVVKPNAHASGKSVAEAQEKQSLSPSPPQATSQMGARRGKRGGDRRHADRSPKALQAAGGIRKTLSVSAEATQPLQDALTTAMRQAPQVFGESAAGAQHTDRSVGRVTATGDSSTVAAGETDKKHPVRVSPRVGNAVLSVEQDRLCSTERARIAQPRSDRRKEDIICRVVPPLNQDETSDTQNGSEMAEGALKQIRTETKQKKVGAPPPDVTTAATAVKETTRTREMWASSFYTTADTSDEIPLHDQVQVYPSAGVTVRAPSNPPNSIPQPRRANKGAPGTGVVTSGGDFVIPADRMALTAFDEKRNAARKANAAGRGMPSRENTRLARAMK